MPFLIMLAIESIAKSVFTLDLNKILYGIYQREDVQRFIIDLNTDKQLREGFNSEGEQVGLYKSLSYARFKEGLSGRKAPNGVVDLFVSGKFYKTFKIKPEQDGFVISAQTDIYDGVDFEEKYGNITGLNEENIKELQVFLVEHIQEEILESILGVD